MELGEVRFSTS